MSVLKKYTLQIWLAIPLLAIALVLFVKPNTQDNLGVGPRVLTTSQGGTGTSTPSGILYGDASSTLFTVAIGSNLTFSGGELSATGGGAAGDPGAWQFLFTNAITPTSTASGIFVKASSTIDSAFRVTGSLTVPSLVSCDTIDTNSAGLFACGSDATGGGSGSNWLFGTDQTFIVPSTTVGIIVQASSTITTLVVPGSLSGAGFTTAWNTLYNATTTQAGFQTQFNTALNATTTLDLTSLQIGTLNLSGGSLTNYFGTACTGNNFLQDIADNGAFSCAAATGGGTGSNCLFGADHTFIAPSTTVGIIVSASSTVTTLKSDALTVGTSLIIDAQTFDSLTDDATLSNNSGDLRVVDVTCTDCLNATEIEDIFLLNSGDTSTGLMILPDLRAATLNSTSTLIDTLTLTNALTVASGGTGAATLTDHGVLIGSGTGAITALSVGTNGQLLIGSTGADPVFATLNCAANLTCATGAGTLQIDVDDSFILNTGDTGTGLFILPDLRTTVLNATTTVVDNLKLGTEDIITSWGTGLTVSGGALIVDDLTCTDCIGTTEIADSYLLNTGDTGTGLYIFSDLRSSTINSTSTLIDTLTVGTRLSLTGGAFMTGSSTITYQNFVTASSSSMTTGAFMKFVYNATAFVGKFIHILTDAGTDLFTLDEAGSVLTGIATSTIVVAGSDTSTATSTLQIGNNDTTRGACVEFESVDASRTIIRVYYNGTTRVEEAGTCR